MGPAKEGRAILVLEEEEEDRSDDLTEVGAAAFRAAVRLTAAVLGIGLIEEEEEEEEERPALVLVLELVLVLVDEEPCAAWAPLLSEVARQAAGFGWILGAGGPPFARTLLAVPEASRGAGAGEQEEGDKG